MAEAALYGFNDDSTFPFQFVAEHVQWIPGYIEQLTLYAKRSRLNRSTYDALINTILVFARARTSALININGVYMGEPIYRLIPKFIKQLNKILDAVPNRQGKPHLLQIYRYDRDKWFVATKNNPRFIWKRPLTHREVGLNLDLFPAGHLPFKPSSAEDRMFSKYVEYSNPGAHVELVVERVLLDYIPSFSTFEDFSLRKEKLFNNTMEQLRLPYRFKWLLWSANKDREVNLHMNGTSPPSRSWWKENFLFVNHPNSSISGVAHHGLAFCTATCRFEQYWPFVKDLYRLDYELREITRPVQQACHRKMAEQYPKICSILETDGNEEGGAQLREYLADLIAYRELVSSAEFDLESANAAEDQETNWITGYENILIHKFYSLSTRLDVYVRKKVFRQLGRCFEGVPYPKEDGDRLFPSQPLAYWDITVYPWRLK